MAAGDIKQWGPTSVANNLFLDLQAGVGEEISVNNVYVEPAKAVEFYYYDGTNSIKFDSDSVEGSRYSLNWRVSNTIYIRVKNVSGGAIFLAADGFKFK